MKLDEINFKNINLIKDKNFIIREEPFGVLIYDKITKRKFWGNNLAKNIIQSCDTEQNVPQIFSRLHLNKNSKNYKEFIIFLSELINVGMLNSNSPLSFKQQWKEKKISKLSNSYPYSIPNITIPLSAPLFVYWELTYKCNLNCKHCYAKDRKLKTKELTTQECFRIIDELAELKIFEITFSGGEPLIRKDLLDLIRYANKKGIAVLLTTNGTLINQNTAKRLRLAGLQAAQVSLDGSTAKTHDDFRGCNGSFLKTIKGIKNLVRNKIPVIIATMPTKFNLPEISKILKLAKKLKVQGYRILECKPFGRGKEALKNVITLKDYKNLLKLIIKERQKLKNDLFILLSESFAFKTDSRFSKEINNPLIDCPAGRSMFSIAPDGIVSPCSYFAFAGLTVGNLKKERIKDIWDNSLFMKKLRQLDFSKKKNNKICLSCKYSNKCGRGCRALAYSITKDLRGMDPRCLKNI